MINLDSNSCCFEKWPLSQIVHFFQNVGCLLNGSISPWVPPKTSDKKPSTRVALGRSVSPVLRGLKVGEIMSVLRCNLKVRLKKPRGKSEGHDPAGGGGALIRELLFSKSGERIRFVKQEVNLTSSSYTHWTLIGVGTRIYPMDHSSGKAPVDVENKIQDFVRFYPHPHPKWLAVSEILCINTLLKTNIAPTNGGFQ